MVAAAYLYMRSRPDSDAAGDASAPHSLAQLFGKNHGKSIYPRSMTTRSTQWVCFESSQATENTENTEPNPYAVPLTRGLATRRRAGQPVSSVVNVTHTVCRPLDAGALGQATGGDGSPPVVSRTSDLRPLENRDVPGEPKLVDHSSGVVRARLQEEPITVGRTEDRDVGLAIAVVVARDRDVTLEAKLLDEGRSGWRLLGPGSCTRCQSRAGTRPGRSYRRRRNRPARGCRHSGPTEIAGRS